jgi:glycosyltransferase involved in cell wall biosynthesis
MAESEMTLDRTLTIAAVPSSFDGSSYYRIWLPYAHLTENSHHIIQAMDPRMEMPTKADVQGVDMVVFQRPAGKHGARLLERLVGYTKLVYEIDDDMFHADAAGIPHLAHQKMRESVARCLLLCDAVTTSNDYLAKILLEYNDQVFVLPNHVKAGLLRMRRPRNERVTVGWAGGTSHGWDLEELRVPLRRVLDNNPEVDMHWMGVDGSPLVGRDCRWTMWEPDVGEYYKAIDFDIAVAPSADRVFNRSKTALRALEMGALGIPVVASNRLPYSDYVVDGKTGFLCDTDDDWQEALTSLINDEDMREEMGAAGREQAAGWTIEEGWRLWEAAYESVAGG